MSEEAVYLLNKYLSQDASLNAYFYPNPVLPFPFFASEPGEFATNSFPYIRYYVIPGVDTRNFRIRRDLVYYAVGEKDVVKSGLIIERMMQLLNISDEPAYPGFPALDPSGKFKIQSLTYTGGVRPIQPSQDEGKFERGFSIMMTYTIIKNSAAVGQRIDCILI